VVSQKLAIAVSNLGPSQLSFEFLRNANAFLAEHTETDIIGLFESIARPCLPPSFACMHMTEGWGYDGPVVATTFNTAQLALGFPGVSQVAFYIWDLEWLRMPSASFDGLKTVYGDKRLKLLARGADHAKVLSDAWNKPVTIVTDFNMEELLKAVS
jgi:hypothetical protein